MIVAEYIDPCEVVKKRMVCYMEFAIVDKAILGMAQIGNDWGMMISFIEDGVEHIKKDCIEKAIIRFCPKFFCKLNVLSV